MERSFKGVWIPKEIWLDEELTIQEKAFLAEIDSLDNDDGCYASNAYFAEFFGLSKNRASEVVNSLRKKGYIKISYVRGDDGRSIKKRVIKVVNPIRKIEQGIRKTEGGIRDIEGGYSENWEDNNTLYNNTNNNTDISIVEQKPDPAPQIPYKEIVDYLNDRCGTHFRPSTRKTKDLIKARYNEGFTLDDFKTVIDKKAAEWLNDSKMSKYLRPETLFGTKFEGYLNQQSFKTKTNDPDWLMEHEMYRKSAKDKVEDVTHDEVANLLKTFK